MANPKDSHHGLSSGWQWTIKRGLQKMLNEQNLHEWDTILSHVVFAYNTSIHSTTHFTPFFLMFGTEAKIPPEIGGWSTTI